VRMGGGWILRTARAAGLAVLLALPAPLAAQQEATPPGEAVVPDPAAFQESQPFDDPALEATVRRLASELRCPTCQALSIEDSPSQLSQQMKEVIRDRLREGMTPEEVRQHFVAAYGEWILLSPTPSGFNLLAYLLPLAALLVGVGVIVVAMRRWMGAGQAAGESETVHPAP
jgi:cytochrome c-type biogenesis protein CcmH